MSAGSEPTTFLARLVIEAQASDTTALMAYRSTLGALLGSCLLLGGSLYGPSGCDDSIDCTDEGCSPSYALELESMDTTLEEGLWHLALDVDGFAIEADCMASGMLSGPEFTTCTVTPWAEEPDRPLEVSVSIGQSIGPGSGEPTDTGDPPEVGNQALFVTITSNDEMPPVAVLGVTAQYEGATVLESQQTPEHEIDNAFNGPGCGSCPRPVSETLALLP